jgi:hypothetical protein
MATNVWRCERCGTVHDFEEGEEPMVPFKCTMPLTDRKIPPYPICGGTVGFHPPEEA